MNILAIIPARRGSDRVLDKNLQKVGAYNLVEKALISAHLPRINKIVVSTDYEKSELLSESFMFHLHYPSLTDIVARPKELRGAGVQTELVMEHVLSMNRYQGYDYVVLLQPTSPLRTDEDVDSAIDQIISEGTDSLFSAADDYTNLHWTRFYNGEENRWIPDYDPSHRPFSQDMPRTVLENGAIYIFKPWVLRDTGARLGGKVSCYKMEPLRSFEVDTPEDLELIRRIARMLKHENDID